MSNIPTREFKTKGGTTAVLKSYITYGDNQKILDIYRDEELKTADKHREADKLGVELVVVSLNGSEEKVYEAFCALPLIEAKELTELVKSVLDPKAGTESDPKAEPKP